MCVARSTIRVLLPGQLSPYLLKVRASHVSANMLPRHCHDGSQHQVDPLKPYLEGSQGHQGDAAKDVKEDALGSLGQPVSLAYTVVSICACMHTNFPWDFDDLHHSNHQEDAR